MKNTIAEIFKNTNSSKIECVIFSDVYNSRDSEKISKAAKLLERVHDGIYTEHFPLEDEREPVDVWTRLLEAGDEKGKHVYIAFGNNLDSENPQIIGFVAAGLYDKSGLIEYIIRTKNARSMLGGTEIIAKAIEQLNKLSLKINGDELKALYWEINDPAKVAYDEKKPNLMIDCMSPQKRMDLIINRYKGKLLGFDYIQAPLTKGQKSCTDLRLARIDVIKTSTKESLEEKNRREAKELRDYLRDFTQFLTGNNPDEVARKDPKIRTMFNQINLMIHKSISPLEELQTEEQKKLLNSCNTKNCSSLF